MSEAILGKGAAPSDALGLFQSVYLNEGLPLELRLQAARMAAQYERPALSAAHLNVSTTKSLAQLLEEVAQQKAGPSAALIEGVVEDRSGNESDEK